MRRLAAALACRVGGRRLYGKPLQHLDIDNGVTILDHIVSVLKAIPPIDHIVLGIAEGRENEPFVDLAEAHGIDYIIGDEQDVLGRLIECGREGRIGFCIFFVQRKNVRIVQIPIHGFDNCSKASKVFAPISRVPY